MKTLSGALFVVFCILTFTVVVIPRHNSNTELVPADKPIEEPIPVEKLVLDVIEFPVYVITCVQPARSPWFYIIAIVDEEGSTREYNACADLVGVDVRLRDDKLEHTSVRLLSGRGCYYYQDDWTLDVLPNYYSEMTILVPVAEDVEIWKKAIAKYRSVRKEWLDRLKRKPSRVLPLPE